MTPTPRRRSAEAARTWFAQVRAAGEADQHVPPGSAAALWRRMPEHLRAMTTTVVEEVLEALDMNVELLRGSCPACQVGISEIHADDCDVAECLATGRKRMWCRAHADSAGHDCGQADWTGRWPGHRECREFGWHVEWDREARTWSRCSPDVPGSGPDLTRLYARARWNADQRQWERRRAVVFTGPLRGGRAAAEVLAKVAQRWSVREGLDVVCEHVGSRAFRSVVADVADGRTEVVVVPSAAALGHGRQLFDRIAAVRGAGGTVTGPGLVIDEDGRVVETTLPGRDVHDGGR